MGSVGRNLRRVLAVEWGRRFRLPTCGAAWSWQAEAPAPPAALLLTRVMDSMIFGVRTWAPAVFGVVTFCAAWAPSRGATRVDAAGALRSAR